MQLEGWALQCSAPDSYVHDKPGSVRRLRPSQEEAYRQIDGCHRSVLNCPTGWGKTTVLAARAARELADPSRKIVVLVPQRVIAKGFLKPMAIELRDGKLVEWSVGHDLSGASSEKVRSLVDFLTSPAACTPPGRVAVATHAGFCRAFTALEQSGGVAEAFADVTLVIDEAHHVQSDADGNNGLGRAIEAVLVVPTAGAWLATAFFFRGDRLSILGDDRLERFSRVHVPFDTYLAELRHLKGYTYDFAVYRGTVFPEVEAVLARGPEPTLIFCPAAGSPVLGGLTKRQFVGRLIDLVLRHYPGARSWKPGISGNRLVVDLTDEADRDSKVELIMNEGHRIAAVLTVGMMKEGADWVQASRCLDLVPSVSDQERNQKFGRLVRDCPGKHHVSYYSFLHHLLGVDEEGQRQACSRLFAHFHSSLILRNALDPIKVQPRPRSGSRVGKDGEPVVDLLGCFDAQGATQLLREATERVIASAGKEGRIDWRRAQSALLETFDDHGAAQVVGAENLETLARQIVLLWRRTRNPALDVASLATEGFDKIWAADGLESFRLFSAGVCGHETFAELREILDRSGREEAEQWARECSLRYAPGCLPASSSSNLRERSDGMKIVSLRRAKQGKGRKSYYPEVEEIFEAAGHVGVFDPTDRRAEVEGWARRCADRYAPGSLPALNSQDPVARADASRIASLRAAKRGTNSCLFYESVEAIFEGAGHRGIFDKRDRQAEVEAWARECAGRYAPGGLPTWDDADPVSKKDAKKIAALRSAKQGKGSHSFYESVEAIFEAAGHRGAFDPVNPLAEVEAWAHECARRYRPGCLPTTASADPAARRDAQRIYSLRDAKRGKGSCRYYESVETIFERYGHAGVFDATGRQRAAEAWARQCASQYRPGQLPSPSAKDWGERMDGTKIRRLQVAKQGRGNYAFYTTVERIFEEAGHFGAFDVAGPSQGRGLAGGNAVVGRHGSLSHENRTRLLIAGTGSR